MATTPNQIDGNFHQIAIADALGNVTGIQLANAASLQVGGGTVGQVLTTNGTGTLSWTTPQPSYGKIKKMTAAGINGMITLMDDGRLYVSRGQNGYGCYYDSNRTDALTDGYYGIEATRQVQPPSSETGKIIDAGTYCNSAYLLMDNGNLYTWGYNSTGQLGLGDTNDRFVPTLASQNVTTVYTDNTNSQRTRGNTKLIIKKTDGKIYGCGYNAFGQLGIGNTNQQNSFVEITAAGLNPMSVWNLGNWVGALVVQRADGAIMLAGYNGWGQLGNGTQTNILTLTAVPAWNNGDSTMIIKQVCGGFGYQDSGTHNGGIIAIWTANTTTDLIKLAGNNNWGSLATGNFTDSIVPVTAAIPTTSGRITQFAALGSSPLTCHVLTANGDLYGWGYQGNGQIGGGQTTNQTTVVKITSGVLDITYGTITPCGAYEYIATSIIQKADGYYAAGTNSSGQGGVGNYSNLLTFTKMRFPQGMIIKFLAKINPGDNIHGFIAVDQYNRWWIWGNGANWSLTNQQGNASTSTYPSPYRVNPYNIIMDGWV